MSAEVIAIVGAAVGMLAVLVPLLLTLAAGIRRELDHVRADVAEVRAEVRADVAEVRAEVRADVAEVRADVRALAGRVDALAERVARIEGALTGPAPTAPEPVAASTPA